MEKLDVSPFLRELVEVSVEVEEKVEVKVEVEVEDCAFFTSNSTSTNTYTKIVQKDSGTELVNDKTWHSEMQKMTGIMAVLCNE